MPIQLNQLALVIPAYKARFFRQTLESIAQQTDKRFTVYVGNDASPDNIKEICEEFSNRFDLVYKRFDENLGGTSLVTHWNRCIELSSEPWIWLFCDDDIMEPQCVEMFYKTIEQEKDRFKVLRFNTLTINDDGDVTRINPPHPLTESGARFIYHRLKGERLSYVSEYIFSRESYLENGGMVDFPIAWCSDDASWLAFSKDKGILTIQGANVLWRQSRHNITPSGAKFQRERVEAALGFINWLDDFIAVNGIADQYLTKETIEEISKSWFLRQIEAIAPVGFLNYFQFASIINRIMKKSWMFGYAFLIYSNFQLLFRKIRLAIK